MSDDARFSDAVAQRFWSKVDVRGTDECWIWLGYTVRRGYGLFAITGNCKMHAHRWAYQREHGALPPDIRVDHRFHCDNRCVNPAHLRPATQKQNLENRRGAQQDSASGIRGVHWHKRNHVWEAQVRHNQRKIHVGSFATKEAAEAAVIAKRLELFTHNEVDRRGVCTAVP